MVIISFDLRWLLAVSSRTRPTSRGELGATDEYFPPARGGRALTRRRIQCHQAESRGLRDGLQTGVGAELAEHRLNVCAKGGCRDTEGRGGGGRARAAREQMQDLELARRERFGRGRGLAALGEQQALELARREEHLAGGRGAHRADDIAKAALLREMPGRPGPRDIGERE